MRPEIIYNQGLPSLFRSRTQIKIGQLLKCRQRFLKETLTNNMIGQTKENLPRRVRGQKGVILFLAVIIMAILLSIGLGISVILIGQIRMVRDIGNSVIAFYAADTGIEKALLFRNDPIPYMPLSDILGNNADYTVEAFRSGADCPSNNYCLRSVGSFQGVSRAIEVEY